MDNTLPEQNFSDQEAYQGSDYRSFWQKHFDKFLIIVVFAIALAVRLVGLGDGKSYDISRITVREAFGAQEVIQSVGFWKLNLLEFKGVRYGLPEGFKHAGFDPFYDSNLPAFIMAPVYVITNDFGKIVYFYAVLGSIQVLVVFWLAKRMFGRVVALGAAGFFAVSFWTIFLSHQILNLSWTPLLMLVLVYFVFKITSGEGKLRYFLAAGFVSAVATQFQAINILSVSAVWVVAIALISKNKIQLGWSKIIISMSVFFITLLPFIFAEVGDGFVQTKAWASYAPGMFAGNFLDIYKDLFIANGKNVLIFFLPGVAMQAWHYWIAGLVLLGFLAWRVIKLRRNGGLFNSPEGFLLLLLTSFSLVSYINYLAYFKGQMYEVSVIKSLGFLWPFLVILVSRFAVFTRNSKYFPLTMIFAVLSVANIYFWAKNVDYSKTWGSNFYTKDKISEAIAKDKKDAPFTVKVEGLEFDAEEVVWMLKVRHNSVPLEINGTALTVSGLFNSESSVWTVYSVAQNRVLSLREAVQVERDNKKQPVNYLVTTDDPAKTSGVLIEKAGNVSLLRL